MERILRDYLLDRPLAEVDFEYLRKLKCDQNGQCVIAVIDLIQEYQQMFGKNNIKRNRIHNRGFEYDTTITTTVQSS